VTLVLYTHHEPLTFSDYTDLETGGTLHAEPGRVYDIAPASGHVVPGFPVPWFAFADEEAGAEPGSDDETEPDQQDPPEG
jgi:hypothetical protein